MSADRVARLRAAYHDETITRRAERRLPSPPTVPAFACETVRPGDRR